MERLEAERLFLANLPTIERIIAFVCRRGRLPDAEADDFASYARVALIDDDYHILRKFEGRSSLSTFLATVIQRLLFQYRVEERGKWRPSAEAKRLGETAVALERLTTRDGRSFSEAVELLRDRDGATPDELRAVYDKLPQRRPRPLPVPIEEAGNVASTEDRADDRLVSKELRGVASRADAALAAALLIFEPEDRLILRLRFWEQWKVADIAAALKLDPKKTYRRVDKLLYDLRAALEEAGIHRRDVTDLVGNAEEWALTAASREIEKSRQRPSLQDERRQEPRWR